MARPQQFQLEQALDAAMQVFWRYGYAASSVQMLLDAMGINRGSLYASFGDKAALFRQVMVHYQSRVQSVVVRLLADAADPVMAIQAVFEMSLVTLPEQQRQQGCLLVNTVNELGPLQPPLAQQAGEGLERVRQEFAEAASRAAQRGQLQAGISVPECAQLLMTTMTGLRVLARSGASAEQLRQGYQPMLRLLFKES